MLKCLLWTAYPEFIPGNEEEMPQSQITVQLTAPHLAVTGYNLQIILYFFLLANRTDTVEMLHYVTVSILWLFLMVPWVGLLVSVQLWYS